MGVEGAKLRERRRKSEERRVKRGESGERRAEMGEGKMMMREQDPWLWWVGGDWDWGLGIIKKNKTTEAFIASLARQMAAFIPRDDDNSGLVDILFSTETNDVDCLRITSRALRRVYRYNKSVIINIIH